ncbi:MAG: hypothetical protein AB7S78_10080 [Candidatus Omnitrophota bacterium]
MKDENQKELKNLSKTAYRSGILPVFLGVLIAFVGVINKDIFDSAVGLFVFIVGYSFVKISSKLKAILIKENG